MDVGLVDRVLVVAGKHPRSISEYDPPASGLLHLQLSQHLPGRRTVEGREHGGGLYSGVTRQVSLCRK